MKKSELITLLAVKLGLLFAGTYLVACVYLYAQAQQEDITPRAERVYKHRPTECAYLYDTGQHRDWADCMGVGYR